MSGNRLQGLLPGILRIKIDVPRKKQVKVWKKSFIIDMKYLCVLWERVFQEVKIYILQYQTVTVDKILN